MKSRFNCTFLILVTLLFQASIAESQINIQRSSDGGKTWSQFGHDTSSLGLKAVGASGAECEDSVIGKTASSSSLLQQRLLRETLRQTLRPLVVWLQNLN